MAAARANLQMAQDVGGLGPAMYRGPSVAGFSPSQMAAFKGTDQAADAFGMPSAINWQQGPQGAMRRPEGMSNAQMMQALTGMQGPNSQAGGFSGYSFMPGMQDALDRLPAAQRRAIESYSMNPHTGANPTARSMQGSRPGGRAQAPAAPTTVRPGLTLAEALAANTPRRGSAAHRNSER